MTTASFVRDAKNAGREDIAVPGLVVSARSQNSATKDLRAPLTILG